MVFTSLAELLKRYGCRSLDDFEDVIDDHIKIECEGLAESIEIVGGFTVSIDFDDDPEAPSTKSANRCLLDSGCRVQDVPEYPYSRAMPGSRTLADWLRIRYLPHYAGLDVTVFARSGALPDSSWTLNQIRGRARPN